MQPIWTFQWFSSAQRVSTIITADITQMIILALHLRPDYFGDNARAGDATDGQSNGNLTPECHPFLSLALVIYIYALEKILQETDWNNSK